MIYMAEQRKRALVKMADEINITLNDKPATVSGTKCDFATVSQIPQGVSAEFAWQTVEHIIVNREGKFRA